MQYSDINFHNDFRGNLRQTAWSSLFPYWYTEDDFLKTIGDEIELIKAQGVFKLLNIGVKPPIMIWQTSLNHEEYHINQHITEEENIMQITAPLYKTWGIIEITSNSELSNLQIMINDNDGIVIPIDIPQNAQIYLDLENQLFYLNNKQISVLTFGQGIPYFITSRHNKIYNHDTPLHNEIISLTFSSKDSIDLDIDVLLKNVVFENEQNIEVTSLESLPIEKIVLYAEYNFPYNPDVNGWKKVYEKKYQSDTHVVYDMITTRFYTKKFYVEVWFKGIDYPYTVGFPAYKDADASSMYHVNSELDTLGELLSLPRRIYKTDIPEEDYPFTFPIFYPFDIEQDYWYYSRLVNEYCYNDLAIDSVDILDTDNTPVVRLHSINPFVEDFVVYSHSSYPIDYKNINYHEYIPSFVSEVNDKLGHTSHHNIENLLKYDDYYTYNNLLSKSNNNISYESYKSKPLLMWFNTSDLPEDVNITGFEIILDAESTDNAFTKYNDERTNLFITPDTLYGQIQSSGHFELTRKNIVYGGKNELFELEYLPENDSHIIQKIIVKPFSGHPKQLMEIPFVYYEDDKIVDNINDVFVVFYDDNDECIESKQGYYYSELRNDKTYRYIEVEVPDTDNIKNISILSTTNLYHPFNVNIKVDMENDSFEGPIDDDKNIYTETFDKEWDTGNLRDLLNEYGLYFNYALTNDSENNTSTVLLHNATLRIYHTPKTSHFKLDTNIINASRLNNTAQLEVQITNNGEKTLNTHIDIISASNLKLSNNYIEVNLQSGDSIVEVIDIKPEYNIQDGIYDIITICEDQSKTNYMKITSDGLIRTNVILKPHFTKINKQVTLTAQVQTINKDIINGSPNKIEFYINNFYVGESTVNQNQAEYTIIPSDYSFINAGNAKLTAKFIDGSKYTTSYAHNNIFIDKNDITIDINTEDTIIQGKPYYIRANVTYVDDNGVRRNVEEGTITAFINDVELFTKELNNGVLEAYPIIDENAGDAILTIRYNNTDKYPQSEISKNVVIIGGTTQVTVFDASGKPNDNVTIKVKVTDTSNVAVPSGYLDYTISSPNIEDIILTDREIHNGIDEINITIPSNIIIEDDDVCILDVTVNYHNLQSNNMTDDALFNNSQGVGHIYVKKGDVLIQDSILFNASAYEPLGFYVKIIDANTGEPIPKGQVTITIPRQNNITITTDVDEDGGARLLYNPIQFTADEWNKLERTRFIICDSDPQAVDNNNEPLYNENHPYEIYYSQDSDLYYLYDYTEDEEPTCELLQRIGRDNSVNLLDFYIVDGVLYYQSNYDDDIEHIYIDEDGYLYARAANDSLRQYNEGVFDIIIDYNGGYQYKNQFAESKIKISVPQIDVDMHSYNMSYNNPINVKSYITEYSWDIHTPTQWIQEGTVNYYIDGKLIDSANVINGLAILSTNKLLSIPHGKHLLTAEFIADIPTYTHVLLNIEQITPIIEPQFDRIFSNKKSELDVYVRTPNNFEVSGDLSVYIDDVEIGYVLLTGEEDGHAHFTIQMPNLENEIHILKIAYSGNSYVRSHEIKQVLRPEQLEVTTICESHIITTPENVIQIPVQITSRDNDNISEGYIALFNIENDQEIARTFMTNNRGMLTLTAPNDYGNHRYSVQYKNGVNYKDDEFHIIDVQVIEGQEIVYADGNTDPENTGHYIDLITAMRAVANNGTVYLTNEEKNTGIINNDYYFTKDVNIIGTNGAKITKDMSDLITNENDIKMYHKDDFTDEDFAQMHKLDFLSKASLNTSEYRLINKDIYYVNNNELVPVYVIDGDFYSTLNISKKHTTIYTNGHNINLHNIIFKNNDIENDLLIYNNGILTITYSIINDNIAIDNYNTLTINRSLMYGKLRLPSSNVDLNNNWWGSNEAPFNVDNHIILSISTLETPPVISESINVQLQLIGANGREYLLPAPYFKMYADSGIIAHEYGQLSNSKIITQYDDAIQEGKIYGEVDNQIVSLDVYDYDRKTEVILESIHKVPTNHQITLKAIVQSVADVFFKFDDNNNIIKQSNSINNGYVIFSLNNERIGKAYVQDGIAELPTFLSTNVYSLGDAVLSAKYIPSEYYFASDSNQHITIIDDNEYCFMSTFGDDNNNGTFNEPVQTLQKAYELDKKILIKDGIYEDNHINIDKKTHIEAYNDNVTFTNNTFINNDNLYITGINFKNNDNIIFENHGRLYINQCIFTDNQEYIVDNNDESTTSIIDSVILDKNIVTDYSKLNTMEYCWFGTNEPNDSEKGPILDNYTINKYYIMSVETSKNIIYIGSVVRLIAMLQDVYDNGTIYHNEERLLPLRIAYFETDAGSLMPLKDYTYHKQATTLLNTNDNLNSNKVILTTPKNINYINQPLKLEIYVDEANGSPIQNGTITLNIDDGNKTIVQHQKVTINHGIATYINDSINLTQGTYNLTCVYYDNTTTYKGAYTFEVKRDEVQFNNIYIDNYDHIYELIFNADAVTNSGNIVEQQEVYCYIDDVMATNTLTNRNKFIINNGQALFNMIYNEIPAGVHTLTITNKNCSSSYETFTFITKFTAYEKETTIHFNYNGIEQNVPTDLLISVTDNNAKIIDGDISIYINDEIVEQDNQTTFALNNGQYVLQDIQLTQGQYSIVIYYHGITDYYQESIFVKNDFNVGIHAVHISNEGPITTYIGDEYIFDFNILDIYDNIVEIGMVNLYVNNNLINDTPINISENHHISYPFTISYLSAGVHNLTIEYIDDSNAYLNTNIYLDMIVNKIDTIISIEPIDSYPNANVNVNYDIHTNSNNMVNSGILIAKLEDKIIGQAQVSDIINRYITLNIPFKPSGNYDIIFEYYDADNKYANNSITVPLIIKNGSINITTSHDSYYPNQEFSLEIRITDDNDDAVNYGFVSLYIDNVRESDPLPVKYGEVRYPLLLKQIRDYPITIVYEENEYYQETTYTQNITVNNIQIRDINIVEELKSLPNTKHDYHLTFTTMDDYNIYDGIIDFIFDGDVIHSYYIQESNKEFNIAIPNTYIGNHTLELFYHDSEIFSNYHKKFVFEILPKTLELHMDDIDVTLDNDIDITLQLNNITNGFIKFYIGDVYTNDNNEYELIDNNLKFIGIEQITDTTITYSYQLPSTLYYNKYYIKAVFEGNNQYGASETTCLLNIIPQETVLSIQSDTYTDDEFQRPIIEATYQETINIVVTSNIVSQEPIYLYINNKYIGELLLNNYEGLYHLPLPKEYVEGEYEIKAEYLGSAVIKPQTTYATLKINKFTPIIQTLEYNAYIGGELTLDNILLDNNNIPIYQGSLTCTLNNNDITVYPSVSKTITLDNDYIHDSVITLKYEPSESDVNKFNAFEQDISLIMNKNDLKINIHTIPEVYRGDIFDVRFEVTSETTTLPINIDGYINDENISIIEGICESQLSIDVEETYNRRYTFTISIPENDIFNTLESYHFDVMCRNYQNVYVDYDTTNNHNINSSQMAHTIEKGLDLVADNGTIYLYSDITDENIIIDKRVHLTTADNQPCVEFNQIHINSNASFNLYNVICNNTTIHTTNATSIDNCSFINNDDTAILVENGELYINNTLFNNNHATNGACIYVSNKNKNTEITNCTFTNNSADIYGGAIYSDKGNNVLINHCIFRHNSATNGASIYINGNGVISENNFYENNGTSEIMIIAGIIESMLNLFDGNICAFKNNGYITSNMCYWGTNDIIEIEDALYNNNLNNNQIIIDSWLIMTDNIINKYTTKDAPDIQTTINTINYIEFDGGSK